MGEESEFKRDEELAITYKIGRKDVEIKLMNATVESMSVIELNGATSINVTFRRCVDPDGVGEVSVHGGEHLFSTVYFIWV